MVEPQGDLGFDLNEPVDEVQEGEELERAPNPAVEVFLPNPVDWEDIGQHVFGLNNAVFVQHNQEGWFNRFFFYFLVIFFVFVPCFQ